MTKLSRSNVSIASRNEAMSLHGSQRLILILIVCPLSVRLQVETTRIHETSEGQAATASGEITASPVRSSPFLFGQGFQHSRPVPEAPFTIAACGASR